MATRKSAHDSPPAARSSPRPDELDEAQREARRSERFLRETLDSLTEHVAIIDARGVIVFVNRAWEEFARANAAPGMLAGLGAGASYFEACARASAAGCEEAAKVDAAIRAALEGAGEPFDLEYPCHSPDEQRWFIVNVSGFSDGAERYVVVSHRTITERKLVEEALRSLNADLEARVTRRTAELRRSESSVRNLAHRLLSAETADRRHLGRELHDRVGQNLSAISLGMQLVRTRLSAESRETLGEALAKLQRQLETATGEVRSVMAGLRPPGLDQYGLLTALRNYVESLGHVIGTRVSVEGEDPPSRPSAEAETAMFRIAQEAIGNALRHAKARQVRVRVDSGNGTLRLMVEDDGTGFDPWAVRDHPSWGLLTMRERADAIGARLAIDAAPGRGTRVTAELGR